MRPSSEVTHCLYKLMQIISLIKGMIFVCTNHHRHSDNNNYDKQPFKFVLQQSFAWYKFVKLSVIIQLF